jgi:predicted DNA-binding antitoxin AbrB/MazE fold protein
MSMLVRYAGKILDGKPAFVEFPKVRLQEGTKITITVQISPETIPKIDNEEIARRREIAKSLRGIIPPDVDVEALRAERIAKRGLLE